MPKKRHCDRIVDCLQAEDELHCEKTIIEVFRNTMRHMILADTSRNGIDEKEDTAPNKLKNEDDEVTTALTAEVATTLITDKHTVATDVPDNIFGTNTFKMETSFIPNSLNRNEFGYTTENTLFASSLKISDEGQSISYNQEPTMTAEIHSRTGKITEEVTFEGDINRTTEMQEITVTESALHNATEEMTPLIIEDHFKCSR